jgi:hypothetical protein
VVSVRHRAHGIATDHANRLRAVPAERGMRRPDPVRQPRGRDCVAAVESAPDGRLDEREEDDDD